MGPTEHEHAGGDSGHVDPVCGMTVRLESPHRADVLGRTWYFCCDGCRASFLEDPARYAAASVAPARRQRPPPTAAVGDGRPYTCPMHPEVRSIGPAACPICGMALEPALPRADDGPSAEQRDMERRFWVALTLSAPLAAMAMADMLSTHGESGRVAWLGLILSSPVVFWAGAPLLARGAASVVARSPNMFTLIALGVGAAWGSSVASLLVPGWSGVYFESAAVITTLVLLGQVLELRARSRASDAIRALLSLQPATARRVRATGVESDVPLGDVRVGDRLRIRAGERVPVDGVVLEGSSHVDEAVVTGEPMPVSKGPMDAVTGGTTNGAGTFVMRAERVGSDTLVARIVQTVADAQRSKAPIQRLADRVSAWFVPAVVVTSLITFLAWAILVPGDEGLASALMNAVAVLIIACPCALGLATPISVVVAAGRGAHAGVVFREAEALERLASVDTVLVDKTGTLTQGRPVLADIVMLPGFEEHEVLRLAAAVEAGSEHPLGAAIIAAAIARGATGATAVDFRAHVGKGAVARVEGRTVMVGNERLIDEQRGGVAELRVAAIPVRARGSTAVLVAVDGAPAAVFGVRDPLQPGAVEAIAALRAEGLRVVMVTGDEAATARVVAAELGIEDVRAGVLPEGKAEVVRRLRAEGHVVAMAGDGVNDAPALAIADVGIAMGTGTDAAIHSAGVTLVKGDLRGILRARRLSRATVRNIRQNLFFAFVYNLAGVPLAAGVLYPWFGLALSPMFASAAMSFSSVSVIANALRLRGIRL